jgi:hypothetical protein
MSSESPILDLMKAASVMNALGVTVLTQLLYCSGVTIRHY